MFGASHDGLRVRVCSLTMHPTSAPDGLGTPGQQPDPQALPETLALAEKLLLEQECTGGLLFMRPGGDPLVIESCLHIQCFL